MKKLFTILAAATLLALCSTPAAHAQAQPSRALLFNLNPISQVCSNMTTNSNSSAFWIFRERPVTICLAGRSVTNENLNLLLSFEFTTNRPGEATTQWFRPYPALPALSFTNNGGITTNYEIRLLTAATNFENMMQGRIYSYQNAATTNNWTNSAITAVVVP